MREKCRSRGDEGFLSRKCVFLRLENIHLNNKIKIKVKKEPNVETAETPLVNMLSNKKTTSKSILQFKSYDATDRQTYTDSGQICNIPLFSSGVKNSRNSSSTLLSTSLEQLYQGTRDLQKKS